MLNHKYLLFSLKLLLPILANGQDVAVCEFEGIPVLFFKNK